MKYLQYLGILLGALYGVGYRLLCGLDKWNSLYELYNIYSISFLWVLPIVISVIPILISREEVLQSKAKQFLFPMWSVVLFFLITLSSEIEDWLCILIMGAPFILAAGFVGLLLAPVINKRKSKNLYSIVLLPLIFGPLESLMPKEAEQHSVETTIVINAAQRNVWKNLIEVPEITEEEYQKGFFNYIGVPRPIRSELHVIDGVQYRIGYFSDELALYETISKVDSLQFVEFDIHMKESKLRDTPTDRHLLNSNYFKFNHISYALKALSSDQTELTLRCQYTLDSRMNGYANFWATRIIKDFEMRLLDALKRKFEQQAVGRKLQA